MDHELSKPVYLRETTPAPLCIGTHEPWILSTVGSWPVSKMLDNSMQALSFHDRSMNFIINIKDFCIYLCIHHALSLVTRDVLCFFNPHKPTLFTNCSYNLNLRINDP